MLNNITSYYKNKLIELFRAILIVYTSSFAVQNVTLSFYDSVVVHDAKITLNDIARISGSCGPGMMSELSRFIVGDAAPAGYSRYMNSIDMLTFQLAPHFSTIRFIPEKKVRIKITTDAQIHHLREYEKEICAYIAENVSWAPENYAVSIENPGREWQNYNKPSTVTVKGLETRFPKGAVALKLVVTQGESEVVVPIQCRIKVTVPVVCVTGQIERNASIGIDAVHMIEKEITQFRYTPFTDVASVIGSRATRTLPPGTILHEQCVKPVPDVCKSESVMIILDKGPVKVSVPARAREEGVKGEMIWVENILTHKVLRVKIVDKGRVQLMEGESI